MEWTGLPSGELLSLLRGTSAISRGFAANELDDAAKAISESDTARSLLWGSAGSQDNLDALRAHAEAGPAVAAYLDAVQWRSVGYDVADETAGELPDMLLGSLRAAVDGAQSRSEDTAGLAAIRERVPVEHRDDFDERLGEIRLIHRLRDERGAFGDGWATGLARRALLETGRRLVAAGRLPEAHLAIDLTTAEAAEMLRRGAGPGVEEATRRHMWRTTHTTDDAPPFLRAMPAPAPPAEWFPAKARRCARAVGIFLANLYGVAGTPNTKVC